MYIFIILILLYISIMYYFNIILYWALFIRRFRKICSRCNKNYYGSIYRLR